MKKPAFKKIVVRMPNWIGDLVMATPILADLKAAFPDASITAMVSEKLGQMLEADPSVDELLLICRKQHRAFIKKLKEDHYDLGLLLTNSFSSAWHLYQGKVKRRVGFRGEGRSLLLSQAVSFPEKRKTQHLVLTYKALLESIGILQSSQTPKLYLKEGELESARELVKRIDIPEQPTIIGINPGAAYGTAKCWLPRRFREVAKKLTEYDPSVVVLFFGDASHKELIGNITLGLSPRVINLAGETDLQGLMATISLCSVFLTNDSGPMHIADSLGVPLVALFGSTDPIATGPYHQMEAVMQKKVVCAPCFKRVCPIDFPCMKGLTVEAVLEALLSKIPQKELTRC